MDKILIDFCLPINVILLYSEPALRPTFLSIVPNSINKSSYELKQLMVRWYEMYLHRLQYKFTTRALEKLYTSYKCKMKTVKKEPAHTRRISRFLL